MVSLTFTATSVLTFLYFQTALALPETGKQLRARGGLEKRTPIQTHSVASADSLYNHAHAAVYQKPSPGVLHAPDTHIPAQPGDTREMNGDRLAAIEHARDAQRHAQAGNHALHYQSLTAHHESLSELHIGRGLALGERHPDYTRHHNESQRHLAAAAAANGLQLQHQHNPDHAGAGQLYAISVQNRHDQTGPRAPLTDITNSNRYLRHPHGP